MAKYSPAFWTANAAELFERMAYYAVFIVVTLYLSNTLGFSDIEASIISGLFSGGLYLLPLFTGALADKVGYRKSLLIAFTLLAAGYIMYGPQTQMALTLGRGVVMFTLDPRTNTYILTNDNVQVPEQAKEFAINCSNKRHWEAPVNRYIEELLAGKTGVRGKDYNMRWVAAMVAEVHRILCRGGIFMYPKDNRDPSKPGKLRLMYEANPMSWLMEQAGGRATNGYERILSIKPEKLHQRVAVFLGAKEEVERVTSYHAA